jgi:hypothetical protein
MGVLDSSRKLKLWLKRNKTLRKTLPGKARKEAFNDLNAIRHPVKGLSTDEAKRRFKLGLMAGKWLRPGDAIDDKQAYRIQRELQKEWQKEIMQNSGPSRIDHSDPQEGRSNPSSTDRSDRISSLRHNVKDNPRDRLINLKKGVSDRSAPPESSPGRPSPSSRFTSNPKPGTPHR